MEKTFSLHSAYHFEEMKEQGGGHKTFGLSKTYPVFLVEKKPKTLSSIINRHLHFFLEKTIHF
jgi:hypothetical protein